MARPNVLDSVAKHALITKSIKPTVKIKLTKDPLSKKAKPSPPTNHNNKDLAPVSPKTFQPRLNIVSKPKVKDLLENSKPSTVDESKEYRI